jgi:hypothetical protein
VVSFNYDRCFAHYLYNALRDYYEVSETRAAELARKVEIFHPYGSVGALPWAMPSEGVPFGLQVQPHQLLALSSQIKTFTEGTDPDSKEAVTLWARAAEASHIVFLGFAFHLQNMQLLWPTPCADLPGRQCIGSAYGISAGDLDVISGDLQNRLRISTAHVIGKCSGNIVGLCQPRLPTALRADQSAVMEGDLARDGDEDRPLRAREECVWYMAAYGKPRE